MKRIRISFLLFIIVAPAGIAGAYNVYADNTRELAMAEREACAGEGPRCKPRLARMERTPFYQAMRYSLPPSSRSVDVRCKRAFVLFGDYSCARETAVK